MNLAIVGCSRRKREGPEPVPALDLYEGSCIPALRAFADSTGRGRSGIFILSALHGLLGADDPVSPYDRVLDRETASSMRPLVGAQLAKEVRRAKAEEIVVIAEPLYMLMAADVLALQGRPRIWWFADPGEEFQGAKEVFDTWGWQ